MAKVPSQAAKPEEKPKEKNTVRWLLPFSRKDLLAASWGSGKGADLLYHLIHKASREAENKGLPETLKVIKFQESTVKALDRCNLSQGCFHTYLKHFIAVGYVEHQTYKEDYTVHLDIIQQAFINAPEKPVNETSKPRQPREKSYKMKDCNFVTLPKEDYELLLSFKEECFNLKELFQSVKHFCAQEMFQMKELFQSVKQNATIYASQEADGEALSNPSVMLLEDSNSNAITEKKVFAFAPTCIPAFTSFSIDALSETTPIPEDTQEAQQFAYSQQTTTTTLQASNPETPAAPSSDGYTQEQKNANAPQKPPRGKTTRKPKVVQPVLVDTKSKAVAFNEAEQQRFDWYCQLPFIRAIPEQDVNRKRHSGKLIPFVHSLEDMKSLAEFSKQWWLEQKKLKLHVPEMGHLSNSSCLNAWIASKQPTNIIDFQSKQQEKDTFAHVPAFYGKTHEQIMRDGAEDIAFLEAQGII